MLLFTYSIVPQHFCLTRALFVSLPPFVCSESIMCGVWCVHVYVIVCPLVELNRTIHPHMIRWVRNFDFYCWISPVISSLFLSLWHNGRATGHMANFCRIHSFSCTTTIVRPSCYTWCATRSTCTISMTISGVLSLLWWPNILFSCSGIQLFGIHSLICSHLTSMVFFSRNMYSYSPAMRLVYRSLTTHKSSNTPTSVSSVSKSFMCSFNLHFSTQSKDKPVLLFNWS